MLNIHRNNYISSKDNATTRNLFVQASPWKWQRWWPHINNNKLYITSQAFVPEISKYLILYLIFYIINSFRIFCSSWYLKLINFEDCACHWTLNLTTIWRVKFILFYWNSVCVHTHTIYYYYSMANFCVLREIKLCVILQYKYLLIL